MRVAEICSSPVSIAYPEQPLAVAAAEMRAHDVGALVVVANGVTPLRPLGILTDRDILRGQVYQLADLHCLTVREVMTTHPLCIHEDEEITEAIMTLSSRGVRRAPVIDGTGALVGIVTLDDLLPLIAEQLRELAYTAAPQRAAAGDSNESWPSVQPRSGDSQRLRAGE